jgi:hypothetical protein
MASWKLTHVMRWNVGNGERSRIPLRVKYWEIIPDNLSEAGWS